uniref:PP2C family serine/threonine-protein phosphatase n=1 Tax=Brachyspira sp. TaxID=1977261 RepID=UPI003D7E889F
MDNLNNTFSCNKYVAQGKSHKKNNMPCQDYCDYYIDADNEFSIIALSDGAGSCKYSHWGSELLVQKIISFFQNNYKILFEKEIDNIKEKIIESLSKSFEEKAKEKSIEEKELSATLLFVGCYKDKFIYGHIGDGIICCDMDGNLRVISGGVGGEFKNETVFFRKNIDKKYFNLSIKPLKNILSFYCFSDGLEPVLISNKGDKLASILQTFSQWIWKHENEIVTNSLKSNIDNIAENNPNIHDDLSLIIMNINNSNTEEIRKVKRITDTISIANEELYDELNKKFEEKISSLDKKIESQNNSISNLVNSFKDLENQNSEFKKSIEKLFIDLEKEVKKDSEIQINTLSNQNKNNILSLQSKIDDLSKKITNIEKNQSDLQRELSSIKPNIQKDIDKVSKSFLDRFKDISKKAEDIKNDIKN